MTLSIEQLTNIASNLRKVAQQELPVHVNLYGLQGKVIFEVRNSRGRATANMFYLWSRRKQMYYRYGALVTGKLPINTVFRRALTNFLKELDKK